MNAQKLMTPRSYTTTPIPGNAVGTNRLVVRELLRVDRVEVDDAEIDESCGVPGDVFAVHSTDGNFAKVKVVSYGYNLGIQWVTYRIGG